MIFELANCIVCGTNGMLQILAVQSGSTSLPRSAVICGVVTQKVDARNGPTGVALMPYTLGQQLILKLGLN